MRIWLELERVRVPNDSGIAGAIDHGLNGIAYPAEGSVAYARSRGLEPRFYDYCCSLTWVEAVA